MGRFIVSYVLSRVTLSFLLSPWLRFPTQHSHCPSNLEGTSNLTIYRLKQNDSLPAVSFFVFSC